MAWIIGLESSPEKYTILGGGVILLGVGCTIYHEHQRKLQEQASMAMELASRGLESTPITCTEMVGAPTAPPVIVAKVLIPPELCLSPFEVYEEISGSGPDILKMDADGRIHCVAHA